MAKPSPECTIVTVALGTRGDVLPLWLLSAAICTAVPSSSVTFVTHRAHTEWLPTSQGPHLRLHLLSSQPATTWAAAAAGAGAAAATHTKRKAAPHGGTCTDVEDDSSAAATAVERDAQREELVAACETALGLTVLPLLGDQAPPRQPRSSSSSSSSSVRAMMVICNLFSLEALHVAEALGVRCLVASPCLVPYAMPATFERRFARAHPRLLRRLRAVDEQRRHAGERH